MHDGSNGFWPNADLLFRVFSNAIWSLIFFCRMVTPFEHKNGICRHLLSRFEFEESTWKSFMLGFLAAVVVRGKRINGGISCCFNCCHKYTTNTERKPFPLGRLGAKIFAKRHKHPRIYCIMHSRCQLSLFKNASYCLDEMQRILRILCQVNEKCISWPWIWLIFLGYAL